MFSIGDRVRLHETEEEFFGTVTGTRYDGFGVRVLWDDGLHQWQSSDTLLPYDPSEFEIDE